MPNKTIYVADADLTVFDRAQELAGENLSATIAQALRHFIETEEARRQGFAEITLKVGRKMQYTRKQFMGRELARHRDLDPTTGRGRTQLVFQTAKGRFVLYTGSAPDWNPLNSFLQGWSRDWAKDWGQYWDEEAARNWGFDWDWDFNVDVTGLSDVEREARKQARERIKAEARARREAMRERAREAREAARAGFAERRERGGRGPVDWSGWVEGGDYDMEVYETLEELQPHIAEEFYAAVVRAVRGEDVEYLDI